jgi:HPt (histidine-containing phosphotransfer) domain-containing protein
VTEIDDLDCELRDYYISVSQEKVDALSAALAETRLQPADPGSIERLRALVHKIAGSAGAYGFEALGAAAKALEKQILAAPRPLPSAVLTIVERYLAEMTAQFAAARSGKGT